MYFNLFIYRDFNLPFLKRVITKSSKTRFCASNYTITRCFRLNRDKVENPFYNCPKKRDKLTFWSEVDKALLTEKKNNLFWKKRSRRHFGGPVYQRDFGLFSFNIQWKIYVHNIVFLFFWKIGLDAFISVFWTCRGQHFMNSQICEEK